MRRAHIFLAMVLLSCEPITLFAVPGGTKLSGKVTLNGAPAKPKPLHLSKEPACVQMHAANPLFPESLIVGPRNSVPNVVVYISTPPPYPAPVPPTPATFHHPH